MAAQLFSHTGHRRPRREPDGGGEGAGSGSGGGGGPRKPVWFALLFAVTFLASVWLGASIKSTRW